MQAHRIIADLPVADIEASRAFYTGFLGLTDEQFNLGWVARFSSPENGVDIQLVTRDETAPESPIVSVMTEDVEGAYAEAQQLGLDIVHPLTVEPWGVHRFFVRDPDGNILNIVGHPR